MYICCGVAMFSCGEKIAEIESGCTKYLRNKQFTYFINQKLIV